MDQRDRADAMAMAPLAGGERAHFFAAARFDGLECLTAAFRTHRYAPHTHDTYVVGGIVAGCEMWTVRGGRHYAGPGDFIFNHPHDVHDGEPWGGGYVYRMTYPAEKLLRRLACDVAGRDDGGTPSFAAPVVRDPEGVALMNAAHRAIEMAGETLAGEEMLLSAYALCLVRHARIAPAPLGREAGPVARARALLSACYAEDIPLAMLAREAGLSSCHLVRAFRRETGLTPHAWLVNRRVEAARARLKRGQAPAAVAAAVGFCDQPHLTRAFKARVGVTPAAYRKALSASAAR
jgi:AraC-like DNA-binding protein